MFISGLYFRMICFLCQKWLTAGFGWNPVLRTFNSVSVRSKQKVEEQKRVKETNFLDV